MKYFDISRTLQPETAVWPGDAPFEIIQRLERSQGHSVNLTTLQLSAHTGTHVDAPSHFADDEKTIDVVEIRPFWGQAQVVSVTKTAGPLYPEDFANVDLGRASRLLVRSAASNLDPRLFPSRYVFPSPELAEYLGDKRIILYGTDGPSMDAEDSKTLDGHHALLRNDIAILEWLDLSNVPDGVYELAALPLKIEGGDGSPVRAILRTMDSDR